MLSDGRTCDDDLDALVLLACQDYNLGNLNNWFFSFRSGLNGFCSRMVSLEEHRRLVYDWTPAALVNAHERNIAIMIFDMDSALECIVFAANALGFSKDKTGFRDVGNLHALGKISPIDVLGNDKKSPLAGYLNSFPAFQKHLAANGSLIRLVQANHDVSKHRQQNFWGGTLRTDPPLGFFERLGFPQGHPATSVIAPMAEVLIPLEPKLPIEALPSELDHWTKLEIVITDFRKFISDAVCLAYEDAKIVLKLPFTSFQSPS